MGSPPPDVPGNAPAERPERSEFTPIDFPAPPERPDVYLRRERRGYRVRDPLWRYIVLFVLTVLTTTAAGANHYAAFYLGFSGSVAIPFSQGELFLRGLWYSVPILAILGTHEMGHYLACRYYGVEASRPYFCRCRLS